MLTALNRQLFSASKQVGRDVFIVAAKRTAIGSFNGKLDHIPAPELGS